MKNENLPALVERLKVIAKDKLSHEDLRPTVTADAEVSLVDIRPDLYEKCLRFLEPTGYGNREASFVARGVKVKSSRTVGADAKHLKLSLEDESKRPDLAILDVMVESMDSGLTTYAKIHKRFPQIQTIFLTSLGDMIRPYFEDGSHEWVCIMEKPVEPISLLATINDRLKHSGEAA